MDDLARLRGHETNREGARHGGHRSTGLVMRSRAPPTSISQAAQIPERPPARRQASGSAYARRRATSQALTAARTCCGFARRPRPRTTPFISAYSWGSSPSRPHWPCCMVRERRRAARSRSGAREELTDLARRATTAPTCSHGLGAPDPRELAAGATANPGSRAIPPSSGGRRAAKRAFSPSAPGCAGRRCGARGGARTPEGARRGVSPHARRTGAGASSKWRAAPSSGRAHPAAARRDRRPRSNCLRMRNGRWPGSTPISAP